MLRICAKIGIFSIRYGNARIYMDGKDINIFG